MLSNKAVVNFFVFAILLVLLILAGISLGQIRYLSLPIPEPTAIATLLLPILTGIGIQTSQSLLTSTNPNAALSKRTPSTLPTYILPTLIFLTLLIYDTILATLSFTHLIPSPTQTCLLSTTWEHLFHTGDAQSLRRIQDSHSCCGLRTMKHMPWPFPDRRGVDMCRDTYHRERSCLGVWRTDLQRNAGMGLGVAVGCFAVKTLLLILLLHRNRTRNNNNLQTHPPHHRREYPALTHTNNDDTITENSNARIEAPYHDDDDDTVPENERSNTLMEAEGGVQRNNNDTGGGAVQQQHRQGNSRMVVQPSSIQSGGNEWRS
ncbi:MAG: hypothetical protein Q9172_007028 [Xanthocarpia lactea]